MLIDNYDDNPDKYPYPAASIETRELFQQFLTYFDVRVQRTINAMRELPVEQRPDFFKANIEYWKHVRSGIKWMKGQNLRSINARVYTDSTCPKTPDFVL